MNRTSAALAGRHYYRARATAWLTLSIALLPLVPVPAVVIALHGDRVKAALSSLPALSHLIAHAIPGFGIPAFLFGCFVGIVLHLQVNSAEWVGDTAAVQTRSVGVWPAAVSGSLVGMLFASTALALAMTVPVIG